MKQRYIWAVTLLVVLLLTVVASCAPAAISTPAGTANATTYTTPTSPRTGGRRGASGTLSSINGDILTLTTSQGSVMVRIISDNTTIQNVTAGTLADLHQGQSLMVMGSQDASGTISATSIMIRPQFQSAPPNPYDGSTRWNPSSSRNDGARRGAGGTLSKIDGNTLTLTTSQGTVTVLVSSDNINIQNFTAGTLTDLHEGQFLNVMGPQDAAGNVTATSIIIQPQGQGAPPAPPPGS